VIVEELQIIHAQPCPSVVEVNSDGLVLYWNHPENVVGVDVYVVVVNLLGEIDRSDRNGIQVQSNKGERTFMLAAVDPYELALTEAHISLERQNR